VYVVQKTTITVNKTKQSHTETPRFIWFPQCEARPQAEIIMKKFTIKNGIQNSKEKISKNPKPQYTQILCTTKEIFP
jgi:hypothetical protein